MYYNKSQTLHGKYLPKNNLFNILTYVYAYIPGNTWDILMSKGNSLFVSNSNVSNSPTFCMARRSNQSILKEINPEYSLEGLMLKLKFQYFGHLMLRTDSLEKTLMLGKIEDRRRRGQ